jgi:putative heme iron utilization protein
MDGYPFASVTPYAVDERGRPIFLISQLAVHTKNLTDDPKASLLVYDPAAEQDPLTSARLNLMGEVRPVPEGDVEAARALYIQQHPSSEQWMDFADFGLYRLEVQDVYYVGGFGEMGWVSKQDFEQAAV